MEWQWLKDFVTGLSLTEFTYLYWGTLGALITAAYWEVFRRQT